MSCRAERKKQRSQAQRLRTLRKKPHYTPAPVPSPPVVAPAPSSMEPVLYVNFWGDLPGGLGLRSDRTARIKLSPPS